jgi:hypothetical protein
MRKHGRFLWHMTCFRKEEEGSVAALGLFAVSVLLLIMGIAIDVSNVYRAQAQLQFTADTAARGGLVALARGKTIGTAKHAAVDLIEMNLPEARYGELAPDTAKDLQVLHYDAATGDLWPVDTDAPANTFIVRLQRNEATGNPLPTFLLGLVGLDSWSFSVTSVAVLTETQRCGNAEGIVASERLDLGPSPSFAEGFCLHSQNSIALPFAAHTEGPIKISLPTTAGCKGACATESGQTNMRPVGLNLLRPDTREYVAKLVAGFLDGNIELPEEENFFAIRPLDGDPEALREIGLSPKSLRTGDVLQLTGMQFSQMRERPEGLVYDVRCNTIENDPRPVWERKLTLIGDDSMAALRNLVLVTDCVIEMDDAARIEGALIFMTGPGEARIDALPGATLGDPEAACDPALRVRLMTLGDLALPADLARSNLSAVAGGSIRLEDSPQFARTLHKGLVLHAGAAVTAEGRHNFAKCQDEATADPLMPPLRVITHIMPDLSGILPAS